MYLKGQKEAPEVRVFHFCFGKIAELLAYLILRLNLVEKEWLTQEGTGSIFCLFVFVVVVVVVLRKFKMGF